MTYDATAVVGQLAGLDTERPAPVDGVQLITAFADKRPDHYEGENNTVGVEKWNEPFRYAYVTGFCGYIGGRGDSLRTGFDDGYDFMGYLEARGWAADHTMGDWPYVIYMVNRADILLWVSYCEGDFTLYRFADERAMRRFRSRN